MGTDDRAPITMVGLSPFQKAVARVFFDLSESRGFLLAGGGALLATGLSARPTNDLDFFGVEHGSPLKVLTDALVARFEALGWHVSIVQITETFARMVVTSNESLVVDIGIDAPPLSPAFESEVGPTFALDELAARKLLALFDRAEARDFVDVYVLSSRFDRSRLLVDAARLDDGFDTEMLARMMRTVTRFDAEALHPLEAESDAIIQFFVSWSDELLRP